MYRLAIVRKIPSRSSPTFFFASNHFSKRVGEGRNSPDKGRRRQLTIIPLFAYLSSLEIFPFDPPTRSSPQLARIQKLDNYWLPSHFGRIRSFKWKSIHRTVWYSASKANRRREGPSIQGRMARVEYAAHPSTKKRVTNLKLYSAL